MPQFHPLQNRNNNTDITAFLGLSDQMSSSMLSGPELCSGEAMGEPQCPDCPASQTSRAPIASLAEIRPRLWGQDGTGLCPQIWPRRKDLPCGYLGWDMWCHPGSLTIIWVIQAQETAKSDNLGGLPVSLDQVS